MTTAAPKVSIVIPTLNEAGTIGDLVEVLKEYTVLYEKRIIIIYEESIDDTLVNFKKLKLLMMHNHLKVIVHPISENFYESLEERK